MRVILEIAKAFKQTLDLVAAGFCLGIGIWLSLLWLLIMSDGCTGGKKSPVKEYHVKQPFKGETYEERS